MDFGTIGYANYSTKSLIKYNVRKGVIFKMAAGSLSQSYYSKLKGHFSVEP